MNSLSCSKWIIATVVVALIATVALAAPVADLDPELEYFDNVRDEQGYSYVYKTKDGVYRKEQGYIDPESGILRVTGEYRFVSPDGEKHEVYYEADENGYRIVGKPALPGAPGISNTVLLSLVG